MVQNVPDSHQTAGHADVLEDHLYMGGTCARALENEIYSPTCMVIWAMAMKTQGFVVDHMGTADQDSLGTQFLIKAAAASASLWGERFKLWDKAIRRRHGMSMAEYLKSLRGRSRNDKSDEDLGSGGGGTPRGPSRGGRGPGSSTTHDGAVRRRPPCPLQGPRIRGARPPLPQGRRAASRRRPQPPAEA